ncbi:MAG: hypothetical protein ACI8PT_002731 [Gammaproteobacteria bacterium]|jgi:hypothetical protein
MLPKAPVRSKGPAITSTPTVAVRLNFMQGSAGYETKVSQFTGMRPCSDACELAGRLDIDFLLPKAYRDLPVPEIYTLHTQNADVETCHHLHLRDWDNEMVQAFQSDH